MTFQEEHLDENSQSVGDECTNEPEESFSFQDLNLPQVVLDAVADMGFCTPTSVQAATIAPALARLDLIVQSRTGSGKTAAFGIPICSGLVEVANNCPQVFVLTPTRELASQVCAEIGRLASNQPLDVIAVYGGAAIGPQIDKLRTAQVVVATPGRLLDHIRRGTVDTSTVGVLVLDECDEMLSMGFQEELNAIVDSLPSKRQTLLFSATIPPEIERFSQRYLQDPQYLHLSRDFVGVDQIEHVCYSISGAGRTDDLLRVLEFEKPQLSLVFCNTRDETARVSACLKDANVRAEGISGAFSQSERERVMGLMRAGELDILVATDIAARGIDISDVSHVINYTFPESVDVYVHRTGRTGRAGQSGTAISLVSPDELANLRQLRLVHKISPIRRHLPTPQEVATRAEGHDYAILLDRHSQHIPSTHMVSLARRLLALGDGQRLLASVLEAYMQTINSEQIDKSDKSSTSTATVNKERPTRALRRLGTKSDANNEDGDNKGNDAECETQSESVQDSVVGTDEKPFARLFINVGRLHGITIDSLREFVQQTADLPVEALGSIFQRDRFSFVDVLTQRAQQVIDALTGREIGGREVAAELAKAKPPRGRRPRRS